MATLQIHFNGGDGDRLISPVVQIPPGGIHVDDHELALEEGDKILAEVSGVAVNYVISGVERDQE